MYISVMKKLVTMLLVLVLFASIAYANGTPEEQRIFFENIINNSQGPKSVAQNNGGATKASTGSEVISRDMATLERLYQYVEKNYLYDIDYDAVYEAMATALFNTLGDKYSYYVKAEKASDYAEDVKGSYGGLGFYFSKTYVKYQNPEDERTLYAVISQAFPDTPCSRAGLMTGDLITEINGQSVVELEADDCSKLMKGDPGTAVSLTIKRGASVFTVDFIREIVTVPTVVYEMIDADNAYLRILEFSRGTYRSISDALDKLSAKGMQKLIIDLRNNPGGDVDSALAIADLFVSNTDLLFLSYKDPSKNIRYSATSKITVSPDVDIAILTNGGTASAAEIFSAAMRDTGRAVLVGTKTFGKGVMQLVSSFGDGFISVTTASFSGPTGKPINKEGVLPDIEIEDVSIKEEEVQPYVDLVNSKAISTFVDNNPAFTDENLKKFAAQNSECGLRQEVLLLLVRNEYLGRMNYDDRPLADIKYDVVCKTAYDYLQSKDKSVVNF